MAPQCSMIYLSHSNDSHQCSILAADFVIFYYGTENEQAIPAGAGSEWGIYRLFIFYPITSQLWVWDTDVNHCCDLTLIRDSSTQNEVVDSSRYISISWTILVILPPKCACWKISIFSVPVGINLDGMTCSHIMHLSTIWSGKRWAHAIISLTRYYYNNNILS